jgi:Amt family ammonium transporter
MVAMIGLGAACLLIRLGLAMFCSGQIRAKNAASAVLRILADLCIATLAFWAVGAAIMLQTANPWFSIQTNLLAFASGGTGPLFFLTTLVVLGSGIVGCAMGERSTFTATLPASVLMGAIIIPVGAQWAWSGWLAKLGFIDVGGSSWLHLAGATCAAVGAMAVGARTGKYNQDGSTSMIPGHNLPMAALGVLTMIVGWAPYLAGATLMTKIGSAENAATSTLLAGAAAGLFASVFSHVRFGKPDIVLILIGTLGGLVAVSGAAGVLVPWKSVLIGAVAGVVTPWCAIWIDLVLRIDDPCGVIAIHGVGGLWGTLATGLFAFSKPGAWIKHIGVQLLGILAITALAAALSVALFAILKTTSRLRVREADEYDGLDLAEHDIGSYPDFQQNTIKSYHLREA